MATCGAKEGNHGSSYVSLIKTRFGASTDQVSSGFWADVKRGLANIKTRAKQSVFSSALLPVSPLLHRLCSFALSDLHYLRYTLVISLPLIAQ